jgi:hypothetical protein
MMLHNEIRGAWTLISYIEQDDDSGPITYPLGPDAQGLRGIVKTCGSITLGRSRLCLGVACRRR